MRKIINIKYLRIVCLLLGVSVVLSGCVNPLYKLFKKEEVTDASDTAISEVSSETEAIEADEFLQQESETPFQSEMSPDEYDSTGGGNPDVYNEIEITISENKYFYDNHEISYNEFCDTMSQFDSNTTVKIYDELASDSAFQKIISYLDEVGIPYIIM